MNEWFDPDIGWLRTKPGIKWAIAADNEVAAWVADMDFRPPPVVIDSMREAVEGGDFGYPDLRRGSRLAPAFVERWRRHGADLDPSRIREFDDVLNAIQAVLHVTLDRGSTVAVHTPTYPPFLHTIERHGYRIAPIPFRRTVDRWEFDIEEAASTVAQSDALILVNPHNPTGRVLRPDELGPLVDAASASGTLIVSDEVHADLIYEGHRHHPVATLTDSAVTMTSATKSFNLAGIRCAVAHVGDGKVWDGLASLPEHLFGAVSNLGVAATLAAWSPEADAWLDGLMTVLAANRARLTSALPRRMAQPEATYLGWVNLPELGDDPAAVIRARTGLVLTSGPDFGHAGRGYARVNFATGDAILDQVVDRLLSAIG
ncbi:MAG: aminotransferase class I/II-fold pyridoxal phosphate-dependent enzyme [Acidimicrobiia bacterium]|nr:aminotransferase class I/II-fold pyridoxal phosphate-dependent enzyme [Acidimicrobiia bacterium]